MKVDELKELLGAIEGIHKALADAHDHTGNTVLSNMMLEGASKDTISKIERANTSIFVAQQLLVSHTRKLLTYTK